MGTVLAIGLASYAAVRRRRGTPRRVQRDAEEARAERFARAGSFARDPGDPVQRLDDASELAGIPLEVDAQSQADAEAAQDLAELEVEAVSDATDTTDTDDEVIELGIDDLADRSARRASTDDARPHRRDAGELYGAHTPPATDRDHPDDDRAFADGQSWIEALAVSAVEGGPVPERELDDIVDDEDVLRPPHA